MLRQLLMVLVLVFGVILFAGCEQDGTNGAGTTDGDGIYQEDETTTQPEDMQDGAAEDEYNLQRGVDQDATDTTEPDGMQDQTQDDMQGGTTTPEDTMGTNGTDPNATAF